MFGFCDCHFFKAYGAEQVHYDNRRIALKWDEITSAACCAIGMDDAKLWLDGMKDILEHPYFERDPIPIPFKDVVIARMKNKNPRVIGHVWVSPHPEHWHKLGYYQVWSNECELLGHVFGEDKVRLILVEESLKNMKIEDR